MGSCHQGDRILSLRSNRAVRKKAGIWAWGTKWGSCISRHTWSSRTEERSWVRGQCRWFCRRRDGRQFHRLGSHPFRTFPWGNGQSRRVLRSELHIWRIQKVCSPFGIWGERTQGGIWRGTLGRHTTTCIEGGGWKQRQWPQGRQEREPSSS